MTLREQVALNGICAGPLMASSEPCTKACPECMAGAETVISLITEACAKVACRVTVDVPPPELVGRVEATGKGPHYIAAYFWESGCSSVEQIVQQRIRQMGKP